MNMLTEFTTTEDIIISIIKSHKDFSNAINQYDIAGEFMYTQEKHITTRKVRRIIERLIELGCPVISTPHYPGGYCWGGADGEALICYRRLRRKGIKILIRARRILRNCEKGQEELF